MSFVYIIEASSGLVKVGYSTQDPKGVIAAHAQLIHVAGAHVVRQVVRACGNASALERALIERLSKQSIGITREWFSGVNVDDLVRFVDDWLDTPCDKPVREREPHVLADHLDWMEDSVNSARWLALWPVAKSIADLAKENSGPCEMTRAIAGDLTYAELAIWMTLHDTPLESAELATMALDCPGELYMHCERTVWNVVARERALGNIAASTKSIGREP
ncbi:hypothetical protein CCO03_13525 [Comamonas serinivorans]|uniref:Bacteriophage T5 Orf172 DNA-binding domain-containing protein n=1 Tax=Comamonas serinivorans TaxID=1082851 RepID=A0A1Y0EPR4_9BURK|nr:GIY-YIG nuclease family protein [Comamonas serinivorans]ARU05566.1 hypothetical protein CCO03_13525 [Comamonas serinivorans]